MVPLKLRGGHNHSLRTVRSKVACAAENGLETVQVYTPEWTRVAVAMVSRFPSATTSPFSAVHSVRSYITVNDFTTQDMI